MPPTKYELRDSFIEEVQRIYNLYSSLTRYATNPEGLVLAEQTIVSVTVALESYISEILVTIISESPTLYLKNQTEEMTKSLLKGGYSHVKVKFFAHDGLKKLKNEELREFIIDDGDNLSFPETSLLKEFIQRNIPRELAFEVTPEDELFIDLLKSTRNLCAHHSQKAARALSGIHKNHYHNQRVNGLTSSRALVQVEDITARNIGDYLKRSIPEQNCRDRIEYVCNYLREMIFRWIR